MGMEKVNSLPFSMATPCFKNRTELKRVDEELSGVIT
jgi:hypothetical protein